MNEEQLMELYEKRKELESKASETKFTCLKECGYRCCTQTRLLIETFWITREEFKTAMKAFPLVMPILGNRSKIPAVYKEENTICPFYGIEQGCTIYERRPVQCRLYPGGRIIHENGTFTVIMTDDTLCPKEAFTQGPTVKELVEKISKEDKPDEKIKVLKKYATEVAPKIPDDLTVLESVLWAYSIIDAMTETDEPEKRVSIAKEIVHELSTLKKDLNKYARYSTKLLSQLLVLSEISSYELLVIPDELKQLINQILPALGEPFGFALTKISLMEKLKTGTECSIGINKETGETILLCTTKFAQERVKTLEKLLDIKLETYWREVKNMEMIKNCQSNN